MADQEIAKHTKKVISIVADKRAGGGWHKAREILLEIVIIVFAVSLSIWLHQLGEHRHEQKEVQRFLQGLKRDVASDIVQLKDIVASYRQFDANYLYLGSLDAANPVDAAQLEKAVVLARANFYFSPQASRYEGFKSAGKLTNIEDEALLDKIVTLYQQAVPQLRNSERGWSHAQDNVTDYLDTGLDAVDGAKAAFTLVTAPKGKRLLKRAAAVQQLYDRLAVLITLEQQIADAIDAQSGKSKEH